MTNPTQEQLTKALDQV